MFELFRSIRSEQERNNADEQRKRGAQRRGRRRRLAAGRERIELASRLLDRRLAENGAVCATRANANIASIAARHNATSSLVVAISRRF